MEAQVFLQLERINSVKTVKLQTGESIKFKLKEYPDTWRTETLQNILPEENNVVLGGNIYRMEEFHMFKRPRKKFARSLGTQLQYFGFAWSGFGVIAAAADGFDIGTNEIVVGLFAVGIGTLLRSLPKFKKFKIGKNARVRIVDLRMSVPNGF